jgi:hypothetical protein
MSRMTTQQPAADVQPLAPAAAPAGQPATPVALEDAPPPRTMKEVGDLRARRAQLSEQLQSAASRREQIARELRNPVVDGADRAGLEQRLRVLDQRILRLEIEIEITGRQLAHAPGLAVAGAAAQNRLGGLPPEGILAVGALTTLTVFAPLAIAAARLMWRRARHPAVPPAAAAPSWDNSPRLDRLEQAVDAIAVELERVSEGQRYVTRLLAESHGATGYGAEAQRAPDALPAGGWPKG